MEENQVHNDLSKPIIRPWEEYARTNIEHESYMIRKLPLIFVTIPNQSTSTVQDYFKDISLHLFQFNIRMPSANFIIELVTWGIDVLISILIFIIERQIII